MLRLTATQSAKVNASIRKLCANYDADGNCLLLSDICPQMQSYSLLCIYCRTNVLPADKELYAELFGKSGNDKQCAKCRKAFRANSNRAKHCPECGAKAVREASRKRQQKRRSNVTL